MQKLPFSLWMRMLVLVTFNPSGHSAYHWISEAVAQSDFGPLHLILLAVLLIGWVVYWIASWRALGVLGVALAALLLGGIIWLLIDIGLLKAETMMPRPGYCWLRCQQSSPSAFPGRTSGAASRARSTSRTSTTRAWIALCRAAQGCAAAAWRRA